MNASVIKSQNWTAFAGSYQVLNHARNEVNSVYLP